MHWTILILAGFLEAGWAIGLKYTEGWTRLVPSIFTVATILISIWMLAFALREIPVGTGYAVWTGIGTVLVAVLGIVLLGESVDLLRLFFIGLILAGIIGLRWTSPV